MKHSFALALTLVLLASGSSQAQTRSTQNGFRWHKYQPSWQVDFPAIPTPARSTTATPLPTRQISHYWDPQSSRWLNGQLITYSYTPRGLPQQITYLDSALNTPQRKELISYNSQDQLTESLNQDWTGSSFVNSERQQYSYDAYGNETLFQYHIWVNNSWMMTSGSRYTNTYTPAGVLTSKTLEGWDSNTSAWRLRGRTTYTVGPNGQWTELLQQQWNGTQYINEYRARNIVWHDWAKQQPASYEEQEWDSSTSAWANDQLITITFEPNGSFAIVTQNAPTSTGWTNVSRDTYQLDNFGNLLLNQNDEWVNNSWVMRYAYRQLLSYTTGNAVRRNVSQSYDPATARFLNSYANTYSSFITLDNRQATELAAAAALYPNPALGVATFSLAGLHDQPSIGLEVFNSLGQVVSKLSLMPQQGRVQQQLSVVAWPTGIYTLRLQAREGTITKRLVKQ